MAHLGTERAIITVDFVLKGLPAFLEELILAERLQLQERVVG